MKVYIITLHRAENYGSVLQAFALQEYIKRLGHKVVIMDYHPERYTTKGRLLRLKNQKKLQKSFLFLLLARIFILPSYWKKDFVFNNYIQKYLQISQISFASNNEAVDLFEDGDVYCTGSDQVWNSLWNEGIEKALFLDFVPKNKMVFSYAASIGLSQINEEEKKLMTSLLDKYEYISVREDSAVNILKELGRDDVVENIDPTLLFKSDFWDSFVKDNSPGANYVLTYNLHHDPIIDQYAKAIADKRNLTILNVSYNWHDIFRHGHLKWCPTVESFLGLIKNANYIVADSFHATAFSLIFKKPFLIVTPEVARSRIMSLLKKVGLENRLVDKFDSQKLEDNNIDFIRVDEILELERSKSYAYISNALNSVNSFTHNR